MNPNDTYEYYRRELESLNREGMLRRIPQYRGPGKYIYPLLAGQPEKPLLNFSSNDYLGLLERTDLVRAFLREHADRPLRFTSASSRLLTGDCEACQELEDALRRLYGKEAALIFNSGYHANAGILPALAGPDSLILADKLVHASLIDGIRLSGAPFQRFRHNDMDHLERLLKKYAPDYRRIFVVTESIFSMDGDAAPLEQLAELKLRHPGILLYVDEAHAFGVRGDTGLGLAQELSGRYDLTGHIDILVATFGKALSSVGAFAVCNRTLREYLVNKMRPLIFSTALPEINIEWTRFLLERLPGLTREREHLRRLSARMRQGLRALQAAAPHTGPSVPESAPDDSHIIPYVVSDAARAVELSEYLLQNGCCALAVRPPTVPPGTSRLRFSLTAAMTEPEIDSLLKLLRNS